jgi:hypothetical protein
MTGLVRSWFKENQTLLYFLSAQALAIIVYSVRLETRVSTLETRGSPHLQVIDNRLTVLETATADNKSRLNNIVEIMTRELGRQPPFNKGGKDQP